MFKRVHEQVWAFDAKWVPDPHTGQIVYDLPESMEDSQVVEDVAGDDAVAFIRRNAQVTHPRFGDGTVTAVEGRGENLRVTVRFDDGAEKSLLAAYAKLQPIDHEG